MDNDEGNGGGYVSKAVFDAYVERNGEDMKLYRNAIFGEDGRGGLCKDVSDILHLLKTYGVILGFTAGIVSPIVVTLITRILWP